MIRVNLKPMSMGRIWSTNKQGRRFLTIEAQRFKFEVGLIARHAFPDLIDFKKELKFEAIFYGNWYKKKDGAISKTAGDLDNFNKLILDGISEAMGIDDCQFFDIHTIKSKIKPDEPFFEFRIIPDQVTHS